MSQSLSRWLKSRPERTLTDLMRKTHLSWSTVCRARRGDKISAANAVLIADETASAVDPYELTDDHEGVRRLLSSRKRRAGARRDSARKRRTSRTARAA
jgi:hypothetical protein